MKKLTALVLALAVLASLCGVPALAAEEAAMPAEEGVEPIAWSCDIGKGDPSSLYVEQELSLAGEAREEGETASLKGYCATRKDTVWTVEHTGEADHPSYINAISVMPFLKNGEGAYGGSEAQRLYLAHDGGFVQAGRDLERAGGVMELRPGESCRFQLPYELGEGKETLIRLQVEIFYPESGYTYWRSAYCLIDDRAVDAALDREETPPEPVLPVFTDVAETSPFAPAVAWAVERGIAAGTTETTFSPELPCTHAHILTFLWRAAGAPLVKLENPFSNVDPSGDFGKAALWAYERGLVEGKTFPGAEPCTRAQAMTYLWKLASSPETPPAKAFADVAADAPYAQAVAWAVAEGVTTGVTGTAFAPEAVCSRGQIVTFLYRHLG